MEDYVALFATYYTDQDEWNFMETSFADSNMYIIFTEQLLVTILADTLTSRY